MEKNRYQKLDTAQRALCAEFIHRDGNFISIFGWTKCPIELVIRAPLIEKVSRFITASAELLPSLRAGVVRTIAAHIRHVYLPDK